MSKRYSDSFLRDVRFFLANRHYFTFCGKAVPVVEFDPNGVDGVRWFHLIDSTGSDVPSRHPRLAARLLHVKRSVNWQLKAWSEGFPNDAESIRDYLRHLIDCPDWIETAFRGLVDREWRKRMECGNMGFMPELFHAFAIGTLDRNGINTKGL